jgi:hypothetical protein
LCLFDFQALKVGKVSQVFDFPGGKDGKSCHVFYFSDDKDGKDCQVFVFPLENDGKVGVCKIYRLWGFSFSVWLNLRNFASSKGIINPSGVRVSRE